MSVFFRFHQDQSVGNIRSQLYVKEMRIGQKFDLPSFLLLANNHLIGVHCCR